MARVLTMPAVAAGATHLRIAAWAKAEGDPVAPGETLFEVEADKATLEVPADFAGKLGRILAPAGADIAVDAPIAEWLDAGDIGGGGPAIILPPPAAVDRPISAPKPGATPVALGRIFATPLARRIARDRGIDLAGLSGSGPRGRIVSHDVPAATTAPATAPAPVTQPAAAPAQPTEAAHRAPRPIDIPHQAVPHDAERRSIAARLAASRRDIPHVTLEDDCEIDALLDLQAMLNAGRPEPARFTITDLIVRATAAALLRVPDFHVMWTDEALLRLDRADVAVTIATEGGSVTSVVRDAGSKPLSVISEEIRVHVQRARSGDLAPADHGGGSITVSDLGAEGPRRFFAGINPPQAAVLAVGKVDQRLRLVDGAVRQDRVISLTLSVDPRAIDGLVAARWLAELTNLIREPLTMLA
jgi:pyruvate dehydrogenase E2 component (dihydrolipoamide acetyltransferase)